MKIKKETIDFEIHFFENLVKRNPNYVHALIPLAQNYTQKGLYGKGLQIDQRLASLCPKDPVIHYNLACSYALVGGKKEAMTVLRQAIELGYRDFNFIKKDKDLKSLHQDPEFQALVGLDEKREK